MGAGEFDLNYIIKKIKCPICPDPYKAQGMVIKEMKLINCYWRYKGNYRGFRNTNTYISNEKNIMVHGEDTSSLYEIMHKYKWIDL